jgi:hypothetical protein
MVVASHPCPTGAVKEAGKAPSRPVAAPQALPDLDPRESMLGGPARPGDASLPPF